MDGYDDLQKVVAQSYADSLSQKSALRQSDCAMLYMCTQETRKSDRS
jgi:hypothetical protein